MKPRQPNASLQPALGRALEELGLSSQPRDKLQLECQTSSVGWYTPDSLNEFYKALPGSSSASSPRLPPIKVLFPIKDYVGKSPGGFQVSGTAASLAETDDANVWRL